MHDKQADDVEAAPAGRHMQRGLADVVPRVGIGSVVDEPLHDGLRLYSGGGMKKGVAQEAADPQIEPAISHKADETVEVTVQCQAKRIAHRRHPATGALPSASRRASMLTVRAGPPHSCSSRRYHG